MLLWDIGFSQTELPVYVVQQLPAVPLYMEGVHLSSQGGAFLPQQGQEGQLHRKGFPSVPEYQLQCRIVVLTELKGQIPGTLDRVLPKIVVTIQLGYIRTDQIGVPIVRVGVRDHLAAAHAAVYGEQGSQVANNRVSHNENLQWDIVLCRFSTTILEKRRVAEKMVICRTLCVQGYGYIGQGALFAYPVLAADPDAPHLLFDQPQGRFVRDLQSIGHFTHRHQFHFPSLDPFRRRLAASKSAAVMMAGQPPGTVIFLLPSKPAWPAEGW